MKFRLLLLLLFSGVLITSCSEIRKRRAKKKMVQVQPFLFETNYFLCGDDLSFSFPTWFNDSLLAKQKVKTIVHKWFSPADADDSEKSLKKLRKFQFDENGALLSVQQKRFYENVVVENISFLYESKHDEMGFSPVQVIDSMKANQEQEYVIYLKEEYRKSFVVYKNQNTGDFLFCVLKDNLHGIVSVDSLFAPSPEDLIQYGAPIHPLKQYQIEHLVEEKNVKQFQYYPNSNQLRSYARTNYPFTNKACIFTDQKGQISGYIDSTFSAGNYLNRTKSEFIYNTKKMPSSLIHSGMRSGKFETFEYFFFE